MLGDFEEALVVCLRLSVKVGVGPGPIPAPPPHKREEKHVPSRMQKGGERGLERAASLEVPQDGARSICCALHGTLIRPAPSNGATPHSCPRGLEESRPGPPAMPS